MSTTGLYISPTSVNVGVGTTLPRSALDVFGTVLVSTNIGIGTTLPRSNLDVQGTVNISNSLNVSNVNITGTIQNNGTILSFSQWTTNGQNIYISGSNVGIGTTNPRVNLDIIGTAYVSQNIGVGTTNPRMKLDVQGGSAIVSSSVGIGTTAPQYALHVEGTSYLHGTVTTNNNNINVGTGTVTASTFSGTATQVGHTLTRGTYLTGDNFTGAADTTWAVDATTAATASKIVARDTSAYIYASGVGIATTVAAYSLHTEGTSGLFGGSKIVIQNSQDGGTGRGIFYWTAGDTNWATYMGQSGATKSVSGGTATAGAEFSSYAIRNRVPATYTEGFIWENVNETLLASIRGLDGLAYFAGNVGIGSSTPLYKLDVNGEANINGSLNIAGTLTTHNNNINAGSGTVTASTFSGTATRVSQYLTRGDYLLGSNYNGDTATTWNVDASTESLASKIVARDAQSHIYVDGIGIGTTMLRYVVDINDGAIISTSLGIGTIIPRYNLHVQGTTYLDGTVTTNNNNIDAGIGTITASTFSGTATQVGHTLTRGSYLTGDNFTGAADTTWAVDAETAPTASKIVARDASAYIYASGAGIGTAIARQLLDVQGGSAIISCNVGIGTIEPRFALDVFGKAFISQNIGIGTTITSSYSINVVGDINVAGNIYKDGIPFSGASQWTTGGSNIYYTTGNVGIGTTTPLYNLHVEGTSYLNGTVTTNNNNINAGTGTVTASTFSGTATQVGHTLTRGTYLTGNNFTGAADTTWAVDADTAATSSKVVARDASAYIYASGAGIGTTAARQLLDVQGGSAIISGNVGIGTTNPQYKLYVEGTSYLHGNVTTNNHNIDAGSATVTAATFSGTATQVSQTLTRGSYLTGNNYNGGTATTWAVDADTAATSSKIVARDASAYIYASGAGIGTTVARHLLDVQGGSGIVSGSVGIGTTNPQYKLHVEGSSYLNGTVTTNNSDINVGSGTVTAATFSGTATQVGHTLTRGTYLTGNNFTGAADTTWAVDADTAATSSKVVARDASAYIYSSGAGIGTTAARQLLDVQGGSAIISGNVGIGTTTPLYKLHVEGTSYLNGTVTTNNNNINAGTGTVTASTFSGTATQVGHTLTRGTYLTGNNFTGAADTTWAVDADTAATSSKVVARDASAYIYASGAGIGTTAARQLLDVQGGSAIISGNVGIGTTNPQYKLYVEGTSYLHGNVTTNNHNIDAGSATVTAATFSGTATQVSQTLTRGSYLTGNNYNGGTATTWAVDADTAATSSKIVARDVSAYIYSSGAGIGTTVARQLLDVQGGSGIVSGSVGIGTTNPQYKLHVEGSSYLNGTVTTNNSDINVGTGTVTAATFSGTATQVEHTLTRGTYLTGNNFTGAADTTWAVDADTAATSSKIVARDASAYIYASGAGIGTTAARQLLDVQGGSAIVSGNVGIGTTTPLYNLHVEGTSYLNGTVTTNNSDINAGTGTVTASTFSGTATQVGHTLTRGTYLTGNNFTGAADTTWAVDADTAATSSKIVARDASAYIYASGAGIGTTAARQLLDVQGGSAIISGNVGIGTTNPQYKLYVEGTSYLHGNVTTNNHNIDAGSATVTAATFSGTATQVSQTLTRGSYLTGNNYNGGTATTWAVDADTAATSSKIVARDASAYIYSSGAGIGTTAARQLLDVQGGSGIVSGSVGIGTTNPQYKLHVEGSSYLNGTVTTNNSDINVGTGTVTAATFSGTATQVGHTLTRGTYLTGNNFTGAADTTWAVDADTAATSSKVVARDASAYIYASGAGIGTTAARQLLDVQGGSAIISGSIGVGTTTPSKALDVTGDINFSGDLYQNGVLFSGGSSQWTTSGTSIYYNSGNVGVGTTTPTKKFDVSGDINFSGNLYQNGVLFSGGSSQWTTTGSDIYYSTGNVGIGTNTPRKKLDVIGEAIISGNLGIGTNSPLNNLSIGTGTSDTTASMMFNGADTASGVDRIYFTYVANGSRIAHAGGWNVQMYAGQSNVGSPSGNFRFYTGGSTYSERLTIVNTGNIGIGTTTPLYKLQVEGTTHLNGAITTNNNNINAGSGTITAATFSGTATQVSQTLSVGSYLTGSDYNGGTARTWAVDATTAATASKVVARDAAAYIYTSGVGIGTAAARQLLDVQNGNAIISSSVGIGTILPLYSLHVEGTSYINGSLSTNNNNIDAGTGTVTAATFSGTATQVGHTLTRGTYLTGNNFTGAADTTWAVDATTAATASKVVARDASAYIYSSGAGIGTAVARQLLDVQGGNAIISGSVGIGTTTPQYTLDVAGTVSATNYIGNASGLSNITSQLMWVTGGGLRVANEKLVVDGDLFVGGNIYGACNTSVFTGGGTIPSLITPNIVTSSNIVNGSVTLEKLDPSAYNFQWMLITGGGLRTSQKVVIDGDLVVGGTIYNASNVDMNDLYPGGAVLGCNIGVGVINTSNLVDYAVTIPKIDFTSNLPVYFGGNVGIGTTMSAANRLTVNGSVSLGSYTNIAAPANSLIVSGNVGIGTTIPLSTLHVNGSIQGIITSMTQQATTTGTFIDFTNIPTWVKRITVIFNGVSSSSTSQHIVQLGTSSGFTTTGYTSYTGYYAASGSSAVTNAKGFVSWNNANASLRYIIMTIVNISGYSWVESHSGGLGVSTTPYVISGGGSVTLSEPITSIRLTTDNGTDSFDAGSMNVQYEG
ncbi:hypothetical protein [Dishui Lake large algae virus 1]|nr:hypothetical protein [Dishui Lake large algae virus 1]